jgi:two-component system, NtrC family, response regulator HydG
MANVLALSEKAAPTPSNVLLIGESGTGKELIARFIHRRSGRENQPFVAVNCAALPPSLLESELFGHVKGAFTGAERDKAGLFIEAGAGTIFLDEVGDMPLELQVKLLRAIQEREVRPVGSLRQIPVQARILAATNRNLQKMMEQGKFREDLYYRLAVIPVQLPALRDCREDIMPLARYFLEKCQPRHPGFAPRALKLMESYAWPGNVRELENSVEYAAVLSGGVRIQPGHLPADIAKSRTGQMENLASDWPSEADLIKRYTQRVLEHTQGNQSRAARILGIDYSTFWRRLKSWNVGKEKR